MPRAKASTEKPKAKRGRGRPRKNPVPDTKTGKAPPPPARPVIEVASAFDITARPPAQEVAPVKVKGKPPLDRARIVADYINHNNNNNGLVVLGPSGAHTTYHLRRPTGIAQYDIQMAGGLPAGTMCRIGGPDGAGKTFLAYMHIRAVQELYGEDTVIGMYNTEYHPDFDFMRQLGIKIAIPEDTIQERERENVARGLAPFTPEQLDDMRQQVGTFILHYGSPGKALLDAVLDMVARDVMQLGVIDSMAMISPEEEQDKPLDKKAQMAARAALITQFQTKLHQQFLRPSPFGGANQTTILELDQVRANKERANAPSHVQKFLPEFRMATEWASNHGNVLTTIVKHGEKLRRNTTAAERAGGAPSSLIIGREMQWATLKGKYGVRENMKGSIPFLYDHPSRVDLEQTVVDAGKSLGVLTVDAGTGEVSVFDSNERYIGSYEGVEQFKEMLRSNLEFNWAYRRELVYRSGVDQCKFR